MSIVKTDLDALDSKKLDLYNLDKSDWKTYRFDEIAINISERVDPNNTDLTVYIGLEHIDSESLHIKRHGTPDDVNGTKLKFYKGDIIFGRRRAYQRKAGIATWDGFCSAHALVLRSNPDVIAPELFPFFLHSDLFMNRAVDISVGSLSPTINWGTLKHQEFSIPPKEIQLKLASLMWLSDKVAETESLTNEKLELLRDSFLKRIFKEIPAKSNNVSFVEIGSLVKLSSGKTRPQDLLETKSGVNLYPVYGGNGVIGYSQEYLIDYPTIILGRVGEYCGVVHESDTESWISDNALYVKEFLSDMNKMYISRFLEYIDLNKQQNKSSHPLISQSKVNTNKVALLNDKLISELMIKLTKIETIMREVKDKRITTKEVYNSLINKVF